MKTVLALDIGGSGVKCAAFQSPDGSIARLGLVDTPRLLGAPDWPVFEDWLAERIDKAINRIGVSCAGFVDYQTGVVRLSRIAGWHDYPLAGRLTSRLPGHLVVVLNDVEAHLCAHADQYPHPMLCIAIGTSMGLAITDESGGIIRPRRGWNMEFGGMQIPTSASQKEAWFALGSNGLQELEARLGSAEGVRRFGYRIGAYLAQQCGVFLPRTLVLSGGVVAKRWEEIREAFAGEFRHGLADWVEPPIVVPSPYGRDAALWGIAKHVIVQSELIV